MVLKKKRKQFLVAFIQIFTIVILISLFLFQFLGKKKQLHDMFDVTTKRITFLQDNGMDTKNLQEQAVSISNTIDNPVSFLFMTDETIKTRIISLDEKINEEIARYVSSLQEQEKKIEKEQKIAAQAQRGIPLVPLNSKKVIYIVLKTQRLYAYEDGVSIFEDPISIVSGKKAYETVTGLFQIYKKNSPYRMLSPFQSERYDSVVTYWLPFSDDYGIHDAWWRSEYGKDDYLVNGTHGCVNVPLEEMKKLFEWADTTTKVYVANE